MNLITKITQTVRSLVPWGDPNFDETTHGAFSDLTSFSDDFNNRVDEINKGIDEVNASETAIQNMKTSIESTNEDISIKKSDINTKHTEVMNKVIPTEATYNPNTIDAKINDAKILILTGAI